MIIISDFWDPFTLQYEINQTFIFIANLIELITNEKLTGNFKTQALLFSCLVKLTIERTQSTIQYLA